MRRDGGISCERDKVEAVGRDTNGTMNVSAVMKRSILALSLDPQAGARGQGRKSTRRLQWGLPFRLSDPLWSWHATRRWIRAAKVRAITLKWSSGQRRRHSTGRTRVPESWLCCGDPENLVGSCFTAYQSTSAFRGPPPGAGWGVGSAKNEASSKFLKAPVKTPPAPGICT